MMAENELCCCFTGHRPYKLPWEIDDKNGIFVHFIIALAVAIEKKIDQGCKSFYSAMEEGVDIWAAQIVLQLKKANPEKEIRLIALCPYTGQSYTWSKKSQWDYNEILAQADEVVVLCKTTYTPTCRDDCILYMLNHCAHMIACFDGKTLGGTSKTVALAQEMGLDIMFVNPNEIKGAT